MVSKGFTCLLLATVLALQALGLPSADAFGAIKMYKSNPSMMMKTFIMSKKLIDSPAAISASKRYGERTLVLGRAATADEEIEKASGLGRRSLKISGEVTCASKKCNEEGVPKKVGSNGHKAVIYSSSSSDRTTSSAQKLNKVESQRLMKAAHEMANQLLHRDYSGHGVAGKPHHKPPINN